MLYRIERCYTGDASISYEYLFGTRNLGKRIFSLVNYEDTEIMGIVRLCFSFKALKICLRHVVSDKKNLTAKIR